MNPRRRVKGGGPLAVLPAIVVLLLVSVGAPGCYTVQLGLLKSGLDSLRTEVDTLKARDAASSAATARALVDLRRELAEQHEVLLSTRASSASSDRDARDSFDRLEGKLDDIMARLRIVSERQSAPRPSEPAVAPGPDAAQLHQQAVNDMTQGRYDLALAGFREVLARHAGSDLADNAMYGIGECWFARAAFDSAFVSYDRVVKDWPDGDRVPPALYRRAGCEKRLGRNADARRTYEELLRRFPSSGEGQMARERLASPDL